MSGPHTSVVIEADGGSRGNPGDAAYGAVLKDADTGEVVAERAECIGVATNNVAEYRGLIAGLELYNEHTPEADLEVRSERHLVGLGRRILAFGIEVNEQLGGDRGALVAGFEKAQSGIT